MIYNRYTRKGIQHEADDVSTRAGFAQGRIRQVQAKAHYPFGCYQAILARLGSREDQAAARRLTSFYNADGASVISTRPALTVTDDTSTWAAGDILAYQRNYGYSHICAEWPFSFTNESDNENDSGL